MIGSTQDGLQEITSDISKLVNLKDLTVERNGALSYIPEAISRLQKLENICIGGSSSSGLSFSLPGLANLLGLCIRDCEGVRFPPSLQVMKFIAGHRPLCQDVATIRLRVACRCLL